MKPQRLFWICLLVLGWSILPVQLQAQPYLGGEVTWECHANGNFRFVLKLYRDCHMVSMGSTATLNTNVPGFPAITLSRITLQEISPVCGCPGGTSISCSGPYVPGGQNGAVQANIYTSDNAYPNGVPLTGTPPATGWLFYYLNCSRPNTTNLVNTGACLAYVAKMYPFQNKPVNNCFDNSPAFVELPAPIHCTGLYTHIYHGANDKDGDSLHYQWVPPFYDQNSTLTPSNYISGYSYNSPFPGTIHHPSNVPASLDPTSGLISLFSKISGSFSHAVRVTSFRSGVKIAEVTREFVTVLTSCDTFNTPPVMFVDQNTVTHASPVFIDTVDVGQLVQMMVSANDFQYCPNVSPPLAQTLRMKAFGALFGDTINLSGCPAPPCATLSPSPSSTTPLTGQFGVLTTFSWQPQCQHLFRNGGDGTRPVTFDFVFKAWDDFCPIPATRYAVLRVVVIPDPVIESPPAKCVAVMPGGAVQLTWDAVVDTLSVFNSYHLWHATNPAGPFTLIDSVFNINTTQYLHQNALADTIMRYYRVTTRSGCGGIVMSPHINTIRTMMLHVSGAQAGTHAAQLTWNHPFGSILPGGTAYYEIHRKASTGNWSLLATTTSSTYTDSALSCQDLYKYRVELVDTALTVGCRSVSNEVTIMLADTISPAPPQFQLVTILPGSHQSQLQWTPSSSADVAGYVIQGILWGINLTPDTVWGAGTSVYNDLVNDPCAGAIIYQVKAIDQCGNVSGLAKTHQTICLEVQNSSGNNAFDLNWNPYLTMGVGVSAAEVLYSLNGAPETVLATLSPLASSFQHIGLVWGDSCCYRIRYADWQNIFESHSCQVCKVMTTGIGEFQQEGFILGQNIPNPAGALTRIPVVLPDAGMAELLIYDITGKAVHAVTHSLPRGESYVELATKGLKPGIYLYSLTFDGIRQTRKMVIQSR